MPVDADRADQRKANRFPVDPERKHIWNLSFREALEQFLFQLRRQRFLGLGYLRRILGVVIGRRRIPNDPLTASGYRASAWDLSICEPRLWVPSTQFPVHTTLPSGPMKWTRAADTRYGCRRSVLTTEVLETLRAMSAIRTCPREGQLQCRRCGRVHGEPVRRQRRRQRLGKFGPSRFIGTAYLSRMGRLRSSRAALPNRALIASTGGCTGRQICFRLRERRFLTGGHLGPHALGFRLIDFDVRDESPDTMVRRLRH